MNINVINLTIYSNLLMNARKHLWSKVWDTRVQYV